MCGDQIWDSYGYSNAEFKHRGKCVEVKFEARLTGGSNAGAGDQTGGAGETGVVGAADLAGSVHQAPALRTLAGCILRLVSTVLYHTQTPSY